MLVIFQYWPSTSSRLRQDQSLPEPEVGTVRWKLSELTEKIVQFVLIDRPGGGRGLNEVLTVTRYVTDVTEDRCHECIAWHGCYVWRVVMCDVTSSFVARPSDGSQHKTVWCWRERAGEHIIMPQLSSRQHETPCNSTMQWANNWFSFFLSMNRIVKQRPHE